MKTDNLRDDALVFIIQHSGEQFGNGEDESRIEGLHEGTHFGTID